MVEFNTASLKFVTEFNKKAIPRHLATVISTAYFTFRLTAHNYRQTARCHLPLHNLHTVLQ